MKRASLATVLTLSMLCPAVALADLLPPPPTDCPEGAIGQSSRSGGYCAPSVCAPTRPCPEPLQCAEAPTALCVRAEVRSGTHPSSGEAFEDQIEVVLGTCGPDDACAEGATCTRALRCVARPAAAAPSVPEAPPPIAGPVPPAPPVVAPVAATGCTGCTVSQRSGAPMLGLALALVLAMRARRARRASPR